MASALSNRQNCTCASKHYIHNEDGRMAPGVCGNGSVPLSHSGNVVNRIGIYTHKIKQGSSLKGEKICSSNSFLKELTPLKRTAAKMKMTELCPLKVYPFTLKCKTQLVHTTRKGSINHTNSYMFFSTFLQRETTLVTSYLFSQTMNMLTLLHSERPKLHRVLAILSAKG